MVAQAATALDLWLYARNAVQFVVAYPYFYLFPILTIARNSALADSAGSDKLPNDSPNFFTAFIFPFKPFSVWVVEQVFREVLTTFLGRYLGHIAKTIIAIVFCAPLKLLLCEAVELLVISSVALSFKDAAQDVGVIPQQTDEATSDTNSTWVLALFAAIAGPVGIVVLLEWFPATVICVRAALSLLDPRTLDISSLEVINITPVLLKCLQCFLDHALSRDPAQTTAVSAPYVVGKNSITPSSSRSLTKITFGLEDIALIKGILDRTLKPDL
ncbi:uncharacterized protein NECHADRAFT_88039 [Fusarium vanettenii 77-13-4]|uniref:Uncharacterized protein n=1 Tax=Fusarium vanettenii (strain ATCC MYA-4622 / CBS 123669 / FGSC 9596 / NRRL 45880 / 77-13-4) TaxID=660122 RepID=C7ZPU6_FUSV7|nr:uncharacterized protein NECHADRAFT_88039 [Fusarium vanettenii 77-13-4]EEU33968.1 predicted protein [Fusarium vanettenii 77-13-4]